MVSFMYLLRRDTSFPQPHFQQYSLLMDTSVEGTAHAATLTLVDPVYV